MSFDSSPRIIDWRSAGYFAYREPPPELLALSPNRLLNDPPLLWHVALSRAKRGDFDLIPGLVPICVADSDPILSKLCSELLGDAGRDSVINSIADRVKQNADNYEVVLELCSVLHARGMLADVLTLLDAFERLQDVKDAEIIPVYLSDCLEDEPAELSNHRRFDSFAGYRHAVEGRYRELEQAFGSDRVLVLGGCRSVFGLSPGKSWPDFASPISRYSYAENSKHRRVSTARRFTRIGRFNRFPRQP